MALRVGAVAGVTVADDLATLLNRPDLSRREREACRDRVVAEIAQLIRSRDIYVGQRDEARAEAASWKSTAHNCGARVRELETEAARLRDGLEAVDRLLSAVPVEHLAPVTKRIVNEARATATFALLAEDGAA